MHVWVTVDLTGAGEQEPCAFRFGESKRLVRAERAHLDGVDRHLRVVDRACGRREMKDRVDLSFDI